MSWTGATTTLPLQGLAEATMPWGPEAMAAVVAAAGLRWDAEIVVFFNSAGF